MKSRKLISLLCAAALTISSFAGLATTASAAEDVFTYEDGSITGWTMQDGTTEQKTDEDGEYLHTQGGGSGNRTLTYSLPTAVTGEYTIEFDTMMTRGNGMGRTMHTTQIAFTSDATTKDTRDGANIFAEINAAQGTSYKEGAGASVANAAFKIDLRPYWADKWVINDDSTAELTAYPEGAVTVADASWVRVQAAVKDAETTVTVIDKAGNKLVDGVTYANNLNAINSIYIASGRGDYGSGMVELDNIHIYEGAPEALTTDGLRGEVIMTPPPTVMPVPEVKSQAPALSAPEGITPVVANDFSADLASVAMGEAETTITDLDGLSIHLGSRSGGDTATTVATADWATGDKVLTLYGGPYSGAGRGPEITAVDPLTLPGDGSSSVMAFAVNLGTNKANGAGRLYIAKNNNKAGDTNDGAYNTLMGVLTTDENAGSFTIGEDAVAIGYQVEAYTWYKVAVIVSNDKYRIWIAKADEAFTEDPQINCDHVGTGATATNVDALPMLAITS